MKNKQIIPIFFASDNNYVPVLHVAIQSLTKHASGKNQYNIHILHDDLTLDNQKTFDVYNKKNVKVSFNDLTEATAESAEKMHAEYYGSKAIYYRVFIPELFPEYKKAIYLDCDLVLNADIAEFFNLDIGDNYLGATTCEIVNVTPFMIDYVEKFLGVKTPYYFSSGVMLLNCEKLRDVNFKDAFVETLGGYKVEIAPDQDILNLLCHEKYKLLPLAWNKAPLPNPDFSDTAKKDIKLVHYNLSMKPWRYKGIMYEDLFWKHAKKTAYYDQLITARDNACDVKKKDDARNAMLMNLCTKYAQEAKKSLLEKKSFKHR